MNKLRAIVLASSALVLASGAQAADIAPAPVANWTGFYFGVGAGGGYSFADTKAVGGGYYDDYYVPEIIPQDSALLDVPSPIYTVDGANVIGAFFCNEFDSCSGSTGASAGDKNDMGKAGFLGRAEIGADYQFDRIVAGVNASFTFSSRDMSSKSGGSGGGDFSVDNEEFGSGGGASSLNTSLDIGNSWALGARLGYLVTDRTLLFAAGGYTQEEAKLKSRFRGESGAGTDEYSGIEASYNVSASSDEWLDGYYIGGGLETLLTDNFSLKLEYRYADYGSIKAKKGDSYDEGCSEDGCYGYGAGVKAKADVSDQTVVATISFRM